MRHLGPEYGGYQTYRLFSLLAVLTLIASACAPAEASKSFESIPASANTAETCDEAYLIVNEDIVELGEPGQYDATERGLKLNVLFQNTLEGCSYLGAIKVVDGAGNTQLVLQDETGSRMSPSLLCYGSPESGLNELKSPSLRHMDELEEAECYDQTSPQDLQYIIPNISGSPADIRLYRTHNQFIFDLVTPEQDASLTQDHILFHNHRVPVSDFFQSLQALYREDGKDMRVVTATHQINPAIALEFVPTPTPIPTLTFVPTPTFEDRGGPGDPTQTPPPTELRVDIPIAAQAEQPMVRSVTATFDFSMDDVKIYRGNNPTGENTRTLLQIMEAKNSGLPPDKEKIIEQLKKLGVSSEGGFSRFVSSVLTRNWVEQEAESTLVPTGTSISPELIITDFDYVYYLAFENGLPVWITVPKKLNDKVNITTDGSVTTTKIFNDLLDIQDSSKVRGDVADSVFVMPEYVAYFNTYANEDNAPYLATKINEHGIANLPDNTTMAIVYDAIGRQAAIPIPNGMSGEAVMLWRDSNGVWQVLMDRPKVPASRDEEGRLYFATLMQTLGTTSDIQLSVPLHTVTVITADTK